MYILINIDANMHTMGQQKQQEHEQGGRDPIIQFHLTMYF